MTGESLLVRYLAFPDWRASQARVVRSVCLSAETEVWVAVGDERIVSVATSGDSGHAPARALYEKLGFRALPLMRYYRRP
jgi:hypothetical protein